MIACILCVIFASIFAIYPAFSVTSTTVDEIVQVHRMGWSQDFADEWYVHGYLQGSDLVYLKHDLTGDGIDWIPEDWDATSSLFFETASDTWAHDGTCTWADNDGDGYYDTYSNTATGAATAGGKYYLWFYDNKGI